MRFVFEPINVDFIVRRARRETAADPAKRRVRKVVLTPAEWCEFRLEYYSDRRPELPHTDGLMPRSIMVYIAEMGMPYGHADYVPNDPGWTVEVTCE